MDDQSSIEVTRDIPTGGAAQGEPWSRPFEVMLTEFAGLLESRTHEAEVSESTDNRNGALFFGGIVGALMTGDRVSISAFREGTLSPPTIVFFISVAALLFAAFHHVVMRRRVGKRMIRDLRQIHVSLKRVVDAASAANSHRPLSDIDRLALELKLARAEVALRDSGEHLPELKKTR